MPIYEYTCTHCEVRFEKLVKSMRDESAARCPKCGSTGARRTLSVFAVSSSGREATRPQTEPGTCHRCGGPGPCAGG